MCMWSLPNPLLVDAPASMLQVSLLWVVCLACLLLSVRGLPSLPPFVRLLACRECLLLLLGPRRSMACRRCRSVAAVPCVGPRGVGCCVPSPRCVGSTLGGSTGEEAGSGIGIGVCVAGAGVSVAPDGTSTDAAAKGGTGSCAPARDVDCTVSSGGGVRG